LTLPEQKSRFYLPSSIRLLLSPGVRGHTLIFTVLMAFLFATAYLGASLGLAQAWTLIFIAGASTTGVYLVLTPLALLEKFRAAILFSRMTRRIIILALAYAPIIAGIAYWIQQVGTVEALPIFPAFIIIFYTWILLQAYFIATPVSQLLVKVERGLTGEGHAKRIMRTMGISALFLPIAPLTYGVWEISNWLSSTYRNVQGATDKILIWTMIVTVLLLATYFFTALWGWRVIVQKRPQAAVFAGGTFLVLWGYLLYRATTLAIGYITQNQPSNPLVDSGLMLVAVIGAMQTFARKTVTRADRRWSQVLPFLVFAFGSVYAVAQFYFILQVPITRIDLSIIVNATVFAAGIFTMMFLIRRHLVSVELGAYKAKMTGQSLYQYPTETGKPHHSLFRLPWKKGLKAPEPQPEEKVEGPALNEQVAEPSEAVAEPTEASAEPSETVTEPAEGASEANDQNY
jgi:hypothetical protein